MSTLPYVTAPGNIDKALNGIKSASIPDRVSQDFVKTILKIPGGSGDQMTTFLKKLGLANPDGSPSSAYSKFRNPPTSKLTMASAIRKAYKSLYIRNEYMHQLAEEDLKSLVMEETGHAHDSSAVGSIVNCIKRLKVFADFDNPTEETNLPDSSTTNNLDSNMPSKPPVQKSSGSIGLNLGYTINLNLPATSDPAVFDAIFKSLKENLLSNNDA